MRLVSAAVTSSLLLAGCGTQPLSVSAALHRVPVAVRTQSDSLTSARQAITQHFTFKRTRLTIVGSDEIVSSVSNLVVKPPAAGANVTFSATQHTLTHHHALGTTTDFTRDTHVSGTWSVEAGVNVDAG